MWIQVLNASYVCLLPGLDSGVNSVDGLHWKYKDGQATIVVAVGGSQMCVWLREKQNGIF